MKYTIERDEVACILGRYAQVNIASDGEAEAREAFDTLTAEQVTEWVTAA